MGAKCRIHEWKIKPTCWKNRNKYDTLSCAFVEVLSRKKEDKCVCSAHTASYKITRNCEYATSIELKMLRIENLQTRVPLSIPTIKNSSSSQQSKKHFSRCTSFCIFYWISDTLYSENSGSLISSPQIASHLPMRSSVNKRVIIMTSLLDNSLHSHAN